MLSELNAIQTFIHVAEAGSFSAAARQNGMKQSAVSQQVAALEEELGLVLLHRTTRAIALTEQGQRYLLQIRPLLNAMQELEGCNRQPVADSVTERQQGNALCPICYGFSRAIRPCVWMVAMEDCVADAIAEVDIAIRLSESPPAHLAARTLAMVETVLAAAPQQIGANGSPLTPDELSRFPHIRFSGLPPEAPLRLVSDSETVSVPVGAVFRSNNGEALMQAVEAGLGIGGVQMPIAADALASGRLVRVLTDYRLPD